MEHVGRSLVIVGVVTALVGLFFMAGRRLPLDFHYQRDNFSFYFPLGTSILISVVLTLVFSLLKRR
jgi:hypothetical protein